MKKFFIQFEYDDDNLSSMLSFLKTKGQVHEILGTMYCLISDSFDSTISLRDAILECSDNSRLIVFEIPTDLNSAWHLSVENSNWLKSIL